MLKKIFKRYRIIAWLFLKNRRFLRFLIWTIFIPPLYLFNLLFMKLDNFFLKKCHETIIKDPIFIMGHPRSGTSTLQKILATSNRTCTFNTWEIIFPSIIQQKLFYPLLKILQLFKLRQIQSGEKGHKIMIDETEEDEGIFLHHLDTEILTLFCPWLLIDDKYSHYGFRMGWNDHRNEKSSITFYHNAIKRLLYKTGKHTFVAKCNPGVFRILSILKTFPDAKIIYLVREPEKSIQSFLSFHKKFIDDLLTRNEQQQYFKAKYRWSKRFYDYFEDIKEIIPKENLLVVPFKNLISKDKHIKKELERFTGLNLKMQSNKSYQKDHYNNSLWEFDLAREDILNDLRYVGKKYLQNN